MGCSVLRVPQSPILANHSLYCYAHGVGRGWKVVSMGPPRSWTAKGGWMLEKDFFPPCSSDLRYILQLGWKRHCWQHDFPLLRLFTSRPWTHLDNQDHQPCMLCSLCGSWSVVQPENVTVGNLSLQLTFSMWTCTYWYFSASLKSSSHEATERESYNGLSAS